MNSHSNGNNRAIHTCCGRSRDCAVYTFVLTFSTVIFVTSMVLTAYLTHIGGMDKAVVVLITGCCLLYLLGFTGNMYSIYHSKPMSWIFKMFRCSFGKELRNSLTDITSRDNVDIGEYDVLEHEEVTGSDLEETVAFNSSSNSSQGASLFLCTKSKSLPICIPRKMKPKKECYDAFRTSSMCSTLEAEDGYHHRTPGKLMRTISEDDFSVSTISSSSEPLLIFSMSPVT